MQNRPIAYIAVLLLILVTGVARAGENWPEFRGPTGLGYTDEKNLPLTWDKDGKNVIWKSPLVGQGHASPIVWGNKVFVCTALWAPNVPHEAVIPAEHVLCYSVADGKRLWDTVVPPGPWKRNDFRSGPGGGYAACTPATDGKLVYCVFSSSVIAALDFDGKIAWRKEIVPFSFDVTIGSSPILYHDTVLMLCAMRDKADSRIIAYDKATGDIKWQEKLPEITFGHASPTIIDVKGTPQLLVMGCGLGTGDKAILALNPNDGKRVWSCKGGAESASIAYGDGLVYFDSGRGGIGTAVDPAGAGDLTKTNIKWTANMPGGLASPIIVGKYLYRLCEPGVLKCFEIETGKVVYSHRLEGLTTTWASPIVDPEGRLFCASAGKSYIIQTGPEFKVLGTNDLGDANHPSPAVAQGKIFLVGMENVYCIGSK
ncbi:MAG TPA: PQQ-binding-like beta-propeller repeat protein [Tepidisphaeraceae bacterium]|jgi:outer membrane protein assembly factor BamB|nr:PQQ-binding-like beta-propeller repeat protein [Tepidisphaeraceae bacterium]